MLQHTHTPAWARHALFFCTFVPLQACMGSDFELAAKKKHPAKAAPSAASIVEVPFAPDDEATGHNTQAFTGRLLGGMQELGGDVTRTAEIRQKEAEPETKHNAGSFTAPPAATRYGFKAKHIDNDGNCLFRAVADQIECQLKIPFGRGVAPYMILRRIAANHIISNVGLYKPFTEAQTVAGVEKLISEIEQDKAWAGDEALAILSRALQVTVVVIKDDAKDVPVYKPAHSQGTIYLYYKNRSHYESLYRDPALSASNSLELLLKSAATDSAFKPAGKADLSAFLSDTANAIDREWKNSSSQLGAAPTAVDKKAAFLKAAQEKNRLKKLQAAIAASYNKLSGTEVDTKALGALLKQLEELLQLERLYGKDKESAQTYLEKLVKRYGVGNVPLVTLLEKAYSQELDRVTNEALLEADTTPQLVTVLNKLAQLHQAQGAHTGDVKCYTDAALLYQTILHACNKDDKRDYSKERKAAHDSLAKARAGLLAGCKAKGVPLKTVQAEIQQDRAELEKLRVYAQQQVNALDAIVHKEGMSKEEERKADEMFIKGSEKLFGEIAAGMKKFIARLYRECERELGPAPCKYNVMGMGSMALQHITPYSDLELAIIMEDPKGDKDTAKRYRDYLRKLTHLFHFRIINLGETVVPMNRYGVSLDHICRAGVQFDLGGKTPLNRIDKDKPYDLIQPVSGMVRYLKNEGDKAEHVDKLIPYLLESTCPIHGDEKLYTTYAKERETFLTTGKTTADTPIHQARALRML
ncbi:MAG: DUF294 nucleotidyltransferase-like domain-containing protein, partial [Bacteroidota bacterium]